MNPTDNPEGLTADPKSREHAKSREEKASDIAYTVNHSISCGTTDIFVQPVAAVAATTLAHEELLPKWLHWITHLFEHEHHDHEEELVHAADATKWQRVWARVKHEVQWKNLSANLGHWATGEVAGDVGGILPTVAVQRLFPGFMQGMRKVLEPVAGGFFRQGAARDARHWGRHHHLAADSAEVKQKEDALYQHELSHLPQAVMWNVFSIPINYVTQWAMARSHGEKFSLGTFIIGKTFGTLFSNTVLIGGRGMAPELFNDWDRINSRYVIKPVIGAISGVTGDDTLARVHAEEEKLKDGTAHSWKERVEKPDEPTPTQANSLRS